MFNFMDTVLRNRLFTTLLTTFGLASGVLSVFYLLLKNAQIGLPIECFFFSQILAVLSIAPYRAARTHQQDILNTQDRALLTLAPRTALYRLLKLVLISQIPTAVWIVASTALTRFFAPVPLHQFFQMLVTLGLYSLTAAAIGIAAAHIFRDVLLGTECALSFSLLLISGPFLLNPLERYVGDLHPYIPLVLHINPLIVVCCIFEGLDIFRNPLLYERTPIPSYMFHYPKPWYLIGISQVLLSGACLFTAVQIENHRQKPAFSSLNL